jgi:glycosyltransferase involved in cell wall biosynthesis
MHLNTRCLLAKTSGVQRYTQGLLSELGKRVDTVSPSCSRGQIANHLWEQFKLPILAPGWLINPANTAPILKKNQVAVIHDASIFDHPEWFRPTFVAWYKIVIRNLIKSKSILITSSHSSANCIARATGCAPSRFHVLHIPADRRFTEVSNFKIDQIRNKYNLSNPFLLYVGSLEPRKNLQRLIVAWKKIEDAAPNFTLVICGEKGRVFSKIPEIASTKRINMLGHIPDDDLPGLYGAAHSVVYPSLYEGYGLPVVEAISAGTIVLASRIPPIKEITKGTVDLFDPLDDESIALSIQSAIKTSTAERQKKINMARAVIGNTSWGQYTKQLLDLVEEARRGH